MVQMPSFGRMYGRKSRPKASGGAPALQGRGRGRELVAVTEEMASEVQGEPEKPRKSGQPCPTPLRSNQIGRR